MLSKALPGDSQLYCKLLKQTALLSPLQSLWDVVSDRSASQLLLHLLLNSKQGLTSVHLCCNSFTALVYVKLLASIQPSWGASKTYSFDTSCQHFDPEGEHSRTNNVNSGIHSLNYNTLQIPQTGRHYQTEVHPIGPQ